jgi:hypothetical protein
MPLASWQPQQDISTLARLLPLCQAGHVNVIVVEVRRGRDSKLYPAGGDLPPAARNRARWLIHNLHCRDGLSIRAAQAAMLSQHGIRRSLGILARDLQRFECPSCAGEPPPG